MWPFKAKTKEFGLKAGALAPAEAISDYLGGSSPQTSASSDRFMYDGYTGFNIPASARMVAGYPWWTEAMWA